MSLVFQHVTNARLVRTALVLSLPIAVSAFLVNLFFLPGAIAWTIVALWYLYRCIRGWLRFADNQMPPA